MNVQMISYYSRVICGSFEYILREHLIDFGNLYWFFNIISHTNFFRLVLICLIAKRCRCYDWHLKQIIICEILPDVLRSLESIFYRHLYVHEDDLVEILCAFIFLFDFIDRFLSVMREINLQGISSQ